MNEPDRNGWRFPFGEYYVRSLQSLGLLSIGAAAVILALIVAWHVLWRGLPLACGLENLLPTEPCAVEVPPRVKLKVTRPFHWDQKHAPDAGKMNLPLPETDRVPLKVGREGFCFLTRVTGRFYGAKEYLDIRYDNASDQWVMHGSSQQERVGGSAVCVELVIHNDG